MSVEIEDITLSEEYSMRIQTARKETQATYIFLRNGSPVSELTGVPPLQLAPQSAIAREIKKKIDPQGVYNKNKVNSQYEFVKQIADTQLAMLREIEAEQQQIQDEEAEAKRLQDLAEAEKILKELDHPLIYIGSLVDWETASERKNILISFLCYCSQVLLHEPISVIGLGEGGTGKTHIQNVALAMIDSSHILNEKSITESAMFNQARGDPRFYDGKIVNYGDLGGNNEQEFIAEAKNRLKELQSDGFLRKPTNIPAEDGGWEVVDMVLEGRPALTYTTVPNYKFDDQEISRSIFVTPKMTNKDSYTMRTVVCEMKGATWRKCQEYHQKFELIKMMVEHLIDCLEGVEIINIYTSEIMKFLEHSKYYKRDYDKYNNIMKVICALNFYNHEVLEVEGQKVIFTTKDDLQIFTTLFKDYRDASNWNVSPKAVEVLHEIEDLEPQMIEIFRLQDDDEEEGDGEVFGYNREKIEAKGFTVKDYHSLSKLNLSQRSLYNYLRELEEAKLLKVVNRDKRGNQYLLSPHYQKTSEPSMELSDEMKELIEFELGDTMRTIMENDIPTDGLDIMWQDPRVDIPIWNVVELADDHDVSQDEN